MPSLNDILIQKIDLTDCNETMILTKNLTESQANDVANNEMQNLILPFLQHFSKYFFKYAGYFLVGCFLYLSRKFLKRLCCCGKKKKDKKENKKEETTEPGPSMIADLVVTDTTRVTLKWYGEQHKENYLQLCFKPADRAAESVIDAKPEQ